MFRRRCQECIQSLLDLFLHSGIRNAWTHLTNREIVNLFDRVVQEALGFGLVCVETWVNDEGSADVCTIPSIPRTNVKQNHMRRWRGNRSERHILDFLGMHPSNPRLMNQRFATSIDHQNR